MYKIKRFSHTHKDMTDAEFKDSVRKSCNDEVKNNPGTIALIMGTIGALVGALIGNGSKKGLFLGKGLGLLAGYGIGKFSVNNVNKRVDEYISIYDKSSESVKRKMRLDYHALDKSGHVGYIMSVILNGGLVTDKKKELLIDLVVTNFPVDDFNKLNEFANEVNKLMEKSEMYDYDHMPTAWVSDMDDTLNWIESMTSFNETHNALFSFGCMEDGSPVEMNFDFKDKSWFMWPATGNRVTMGSKVDYNRLKKEMEIYLNQHIKDMKEYDDEDYINWANILLNFIKKYKF